MDGWIFSYTKLFRIILNDMLWNFCNSCSPSTNATFMTTSPELFVLKHQPRIKVKANNYWKWSTYKKTTLLKL